MEIKRAEMEKQDLEMLKTAIRDSVKILEEVADKIGDCSNFVSEKFKQLEEKTKIIKDSTSGKVIKDIPTTVNLHHAAFRSEEMIRYWNEDANKDIIYVRLTARDIAKELRERYKELYGEVI